MTGQLVLGLYSTCLCFQLPLEFTAGTCKGSHREVNGLQDKGQSCWERSGGKKQKESEWGGKYVSEKEEKDGAKVQTGQTRSCCKRQRVSKLV